LQCEVYDLHTWVALGMYFSYKLQGAVEFAMFQKDPSSGKEHQVSARATHHHL
jgi:hypothetical protein